MTKKNVFIEQKIKEAQDFLCESGSVINELQDYIEKHERNNKNYSKSLKALEWEKERLMDIFVDLYKISVQITIS